MDPNISPNALEPQIGLAVRGTGIILTNNKLSNMSIYIGMSGAGAPGAIAANNQLQDAVFYIIASDNVQILNNTIVISPHYSNAWSGIYVVNSNYPLITNNTITSIAGNDDGIEPCRISRRRFHRRKDIIEHHLEFRRLHDRDRRT